MDITQIVTIENFLSQIVINILGNIDYNDPTSRHSPPPSASSANVTASLGSPSNEEPSTPNTTQDTTDADFEPSSLSLAERLAFFSSLCEGNGGSTTPTSSMPHHVAHPRFASRANSYASRSSPPYNSIDRSSNSPSSNHSNHSMANSISSASVTPTPMECTPTTQEEEQQQQQQSLTEQHNGFVQLTRSATAPPTATTATTAVTTSTIVTPLTESTSLTAPRRIKLRTVGKLVMPDTFLSDRKHNNHRNSCLGRLQTMEDIHISMGVRTIGKIKSPFIEQQQQKELRKQQSMQAMEQQSNGNGHSLSDSGDDAHSSDSGKENCAANQQQQQQQQQQETQQQPQSQQQQSQQVQELKRKLTHFSQITVQQKKPQATAVNRRHTTELSGNIRAPNVDERYAKYFGLNESYSSTTTLLKKTSSTVPPTPTATPSEALNAHVRLPQTVANGSGLNQSVSLVQKRREMLKRTRAMSLETTGSCASSGSLSPTSMPSPKRALSPSRRSTTTTSNNKLNIASFEDIVITADELHAAGHEFKRLCGEILGT
ncbi:ras-interacting protein RIP3 isoform X13 [Drosophila sulfurigaster albostrigata]|uniref:ras-interacting protein RIP3 isoform X13 n=1 Tax=Drosophila sulfurigaster albostrigata TaxID=89887 RepID=UPI002D219823|nr:ras-interacting protein RIP3 isoform X13 [Drosophila sulfurigaster albostrigata]